MIDSGCHGPLLPFDLSIEIVARCSWKRTWSGCPKHQLSSAMHEMLRRRKGARLNGLLLLLLLSFFATRVLPATFEHNCTKTHITESSCQVASMQLLLWSKTCIVCERFVRFCARVIRKYSHFNKFIANV